MKRIYLGLGSNLGQPLEHLAAGLRALQNLPQACLIAVSRIYRTKPIGGPQQDDYFNLAALITYFGELDEALRDCQAIEHSNLRCRTERWGPRTLDIDLLYSPDGQSNNAKLQLPHPRVIERLFVLAPLLELPEADRISINDKLLQEWASLQDETQVQLTSFYWSGADIVESNKV